MQGPTDPYPDVLRQAIHAYVTGEERVADRLLDQIAFAPSPRQVERGPSRAVIARTYAADRYQCRYCGERVILTPVMRLLARLYPREFPYHPNWKSDSTHPAFVTRSATLDHVVPIAAGGDPVDPRNLATACWGCNRRKGDLRLEAIGWTLRKPTDLAWRGLTELYKPLWEAAGRPALSEDERAWLRLTS